MIKIANLTNPFANISIGSMSTWATVILIILIAVLVIGLFVTIFYIIYIKKKYYLKIVVKRMVGNTPQKVAEYSAREVFFGQAGDKLWRVSNKGINKIPVYKWLPVGKHQSGNNEYTYWVRQKDNEWINYLDTDMDEIFDRMNVRYTQEDMRLQRLATEKLLRERHLQKSFWDQWGGLIMTIILFLLIAISVAIIFYQLGYVIDKLGPLIDMITKGLEMIEKNCEINQTTGQLYPKTTEGLIPTTA